MGLTPFLAGWLLVAALMTALWFVQRARHDAGVVDVGWAAGLGLLALVHAAFADTWEPRRWLVVILACGWSFRLASYLYVNRIAGHRVEDGRYQALRAQWGVRQQPYLFLFFQAQAVVDVLLSLPFWLALRNPAPAFGALELAGAALSMACGAGHATRTTSSNGFTGGAGC
jgi:steroid 5-alpha reductase family enzyme